MISYGVGCASGQLMITTWLGRRATPLDSKDTKIQDDPVKDATTLLAHGEVRSGMGAATRFAWQERDQTHERGRRPTRTGAAGEHSVLLGNKKAKICLVSGPEQSIFTLCLFFFLVIIFYHTEVN